MNNIRLTKRGERVASFLGVLALVLLMGFAGWIEGGML